MATLRIRDDVVYREVDDVIVAFSLDTGEYVALDPIGTDLWRFIEQDGRVSAVRNRLLASYDIDEASCDEELGGFIAMLEARRLVAVDSAPDQPPPRPRRSAGAAAKAEDHRLRTQKE